MKSERRWLVDAIREKLVPELLGCGFEVAKLSKSEDNSDDRALLASFPFGLLRRKTGRGFEQIEIELISRGRVSVRVNFGSLPAEGIKGISGHVDASEVLVTWLDKYFVLCERRRFFKPFSIRRPWWSKREVTKVDYELLVDKLIALLPEMDEALRNQKEGPHVRQAGAVSS